MRKIIFRTSLLISCAALISVSSAFGETEKLHIECFAESGMGFDVGNQQWVARKQPEGGSLDSRVVIRELGQVESIGLVGKKTITPVVFDYENSKVLAVCSQYYESLSCIAEDLYGSWNVDLKTMLYHYASGRAEQFLQGTPQKEPFFGIGVGRCSSVHK